LRRFSAIDDGRGDVGRQTGKTHARRGLRQARVFVAMSARDNMLLAAPRQQKEAPHGMLFDRARTRRADIAALAHALVSSCNFRLDLLLAADATELRRL
jgi:hypothetical protein